MNRTLTATLTTIACTSSILFASPGQAEDAYTDDLTLFEFPGGNLVEYLEAVDAAFDECSIVIFPGGLEKIMVPAMSVNTFGYDELIELVQNTRANGRTSEGRGKSWSVMPDVNPISEHVYSVSPLVTGSPFSAASSGEDDSSVAVYAGPRHFEMSEVLDAIGAGIEMAVGAEGAIVRYHEPTSLIFVVTTEPGHDVVDAILGQLRRGIPKDGFGDRKQEEESGIIGLQEQITYLQTRMLELEAANTRLTVELEERMKESSGDDE